MNKLKRKIITSLPLPLILASRDSKECCSNWRRSATFQSAIIVVTDTFRGHNGLLDEDCMVASLMRRKTFRVRSAILTLLNSPAVTFLKVYNRSRRDKLIRGCSQPVMLEVTDHACSASHNLHVLATVLMLRSFSDLWMAISDSIRTWRIFCYTFAYS